MNVLSIELRKEKRTGVIPVLLAVGVLGAAYAFVNFLVRKVTVTFFPYFSGRKKNNPGTQKSPGTRMSPGQEFSSLRSENSTEKLLGRLRSAHFPCVKPQFSRNEKQQAKGLLQTGAGNVT